MIDSKTIAPTRPAGTDYAASHIGTATPNNCATTPRWRSLACPTPLRLTAARDRALMLRCGELQWQLFCACSRGRPLLPVATGAVLVTVRRPGAALDGPTSERHAVARPRPGARRKTPPAVPSRPPNTVRRLGMPERTQGRQRDGATNRAQPLPPRHRGDALHILQRADRSSEKIEEIGI
jgi:hypothetical protein